MDPISQLGWRNRRGAIEGPGEQLLRDVFEAADVVHSDAMSEMVGSRNDDGCPVNVEATGSHGHTQRSPTASVEIDKEGEPRVHPSPTRSVEIDQEGGPRVHPPLNQQPILYVTIYVSMGRAPLNCHSISLINS